MRCETENFVDGRRTERFYSPTDVLQRIATFAADGSLTATIDYVYAANGCNTERVLRDGQGVILRRIQLDDEGQEVGDAPSGPVRWRSLDGAASGEAEKGQEQLGQQEFGRPGIDSEN